MSLANSYKYPPAKNVSPSPSKVSNRMNGTGMSTSARSKGFQSTNDFSKHLKNLQQQQSDENVEDEYIKNLQQQIAYQELELKLLKEKELEQKQSVSQIDKFFNDGVPLNENILALKNQYNHIKKNMENRIDELNELRVDEKKAALDLKKHYDNGSNQLKVIIETLEKKEKEFSVHMAESRMAFLNERHRRLQADKELKKIQSMLKEKNDENLKMTRDLEREAILVQHKEEMLKNKRNKTKEDIKAKDDWAVSLQKEVEKKRGEVAFNPEITMLEGENLDLQARILRCDKETNMSIARVKEMEMFLETRSRERELEADMKRDLVAKINQVKFRIDEQNKLNEVEIKRKVEQKEDSDKKDLEKEINDVRNEKTIVKQRQQEKEDHIKELAQEKMGVQQDIMALEQETETINKEVRENKEFLINLKNKFEALTLEEKDLTVKLDPIVIDITKMQKIIPAIEENNEKLKEQIAHMEKLSELSLQIKNVNLEELKMLNQSNDQVQNTISDLIRKWDFLQRLGATKS